MALTKPTVWKGITWNDAYLKISKVEIQDYLTVNPETEETVKKYRATLTATLYTDNTKQETIDWIPVWHEYNINNNTVDTLTVDNLDITDLNFATYYSKFKLIPQLSDWTDC